MSSLPRRLQRKVLRSRKDYERPEPRTRVLADGGYAVLSPTKGWRAFSARRVNAFQVTLAKRNGALPWWHGIPALEAAARG